jgi:hypothetical protein
LFPNENEKNIISLGKFSLSIISYLLQRLARHTPMTICKRSILNATELSLESLIMLPQDYKNIFPNYFIFFLIDEFFDLSLTATP